MAIKTLFNLLLLYLFFFQINDTNVDFAFKLAKFNSKDTFEEMSSSLIVFQFQLDFIV